MRSAPQLGWHLQLVLFFPPYALVNRLFLRQGRSNVVNLTAVCRCADLRSLEHPEPATGDHASSAGLRLRGGVGRRDCPDGRAGLCSGRQKDARVGAAASADIVLPCCVNARYRTFGRASGYVVRPQKALNAPNCVEKGPFCRAPVLFLRWPSALRGALIAAQFGASEGAEATGTSL